MSELAIASWGGLISAPTDASEQTFHRILNAIFSILRIQLGILASVQKNFTIDNYLTITAKNSIHFEALKHQLDHTIEHLNKTVHFINSLHDLKAKIVDLIISDEVAKMAWKAHSEFFKAYKGILENSIGVFLLF